MRRPPSVFLDTNVLKASVDTRLVLRPEPQKINWGGREFEVDVHRPIYINQNTKYLAQGNRERFEDTVALRFIAALAKEGKIHLVMHQEVLFELMGLPRATGGPRFYGAPIEKVEGPFQYSRTVVDGTDHDYQYEFLSRVEHPRFKELQRACGAYQGQNKPLQRNQLLDAFHILCAESASATHFLTLDDSLIRVLTNQSPRKTTVTPITPKRLLVSLVCRRPTWLRSIWRERARLLKSGRKPNADDQDASREFWS
ncbi:MAG: hypothetical protein M1392_06535 [Gammaproteobacteria bacterium]|nr:hypothetical protein [Gammaproteobacteria bacterium]